MTNSEKIKILFFGELPPSVVHGVSISNKINTGILADIGKVTIVEEKWALKYHNRFAFKKVVNVIRSVADIWRVAGSQSYDLYYSVLSVSFLGAIKQILIVLAIKMRNSRTQLLYHVHRSDLLTIWERNYFFKVYLWWLNRLNTGFILLSTMQKEECQTFLNEVFVLYNAIDENEVYPIQTEKNDNRIRFLYLSNYMKEKGILDLLNVFCLLDDEQPVLLECYGGDTDEQVKKEIHHIAGNSRRISIHGPVYGNKKNEVLNRADILVLPSYNEGFPLVILEAMRVNKAVIVTNTGYIVELLGEDYPLYCKPGDTQSLISAIRKANTLYNSETIKKTIQERYKPVSTDMHRVQLRKIVESHSGVGAEA